MPNKISTIFFDVGGVLLKINLMPMMAEFSRLTGLSFEEMAHDRDDSHYFALERGDITIRQYHDLALRSRDGQQLMTFERFVELWNNVLDEPTGVHPMLPTLKKQANLWLLTNTNETHLPHILKRHKFLNAVDGVVASHEIGMRKPEPEIYRYALEQAGIRPEEAMFIDDMPENVEASRAAGITTHRFVDRPGLEAFLTEHDFSLT